MRLLTFPFFMQVICFAFLQNKESQHYEIDLGQATIEQYCRYYDYPLEHHKITTEDNYILTYHRI